MPASRTASARQPAIASLIVYVEADGAPEQRVEIAAELALRFGAVLTGFAARALPPPFIAEGVIIDEAGPAEREALRHRLAARETWFRGAAGQAVREVVWQSALAEPTEALVEAARGADLVVLGTADPRAALGADPYALLDVGEVLLRLGRPAFVVPPGVGPWRGDHAVVAWKDAREARRAVADSLPLLAQSRRVSVVEIAAAGAEVEARRRVEDVAHYLARHGIIADPKVIAHRGRSDSDHLVDYAVSSGGDLIVAGAYGHSRLGEWIFGGMTRHLVASSPLCCLLSH